MFDLFFIVLGYSLARLDKKSWPKQNILSQLYFHTMQLRYAASEQKATTQYASLEKTNAYLPSSKEIKQDMTAAAPGQNQSMGRIKISKPQYLLLIFTMHELFQIFLVRSKSQIRLNRCFLYYVKLSATVVLFAMLDQDGQALH